MTEAYVTNGMMSYCIDEAVGLSDGHAVIEGTFRQTTGAWTGLFESIHGNTFVVQDGYIKEVIA